ncbi:MAG TPA: hypothetical protein VLH59_13005 [Ignavibacteriaceae bacterium]|nr:hypothetical protein [Ignavibacteriaceae bacterium]
MEHIKDYLSKTKSAVQKVFEAYDSYLELMKIPQRPAFFYWGDPNSEENKQAYAKWRIENKEVLKERHHRDDEYAFELFARSTLAGTILQFAYNGINIFSKNNLANENFKNIIKPNSRPAKFCIGRLIDDIPIGLIIYAGRNQAMHFDDKDINELNKSVFYKLANWYSPTFKKWFVDSYYDLNNDQIIHYAGNILYKLGWSAYIFYEQDMLEMLQNNI